MGQNNKNNCPDNNCAEVLDLACAVYHFQQTNEPSRLIRLNFPNGAPANTIFEKIDYVLGTIPYQPLSKIDTNSIAINLSGAGNHEVGASIKLSYLSGNTAVINPDGIYVPPIPDLYKIKVNPTATPYYLEDALIGGSDGIASLQFNASRGVLYGQPSGNTTNFVKAIVNDPSILFNLTGSIVNSLISNSSFLNTLSQLEKTAILNDSNAINNLAIAMIHNPDAMANLCNALNECTGGTSCPDPYIVSSAVGVEATGGTVVLTINYVDSVPPAASGYTLSYRPKGSSTPYTIAGPFFSSPIQVFGLPISDYEGILTAECSGSTQSSGATWIATLPCMKTVADGYILGSNCNGVPTILYTSEAFRIGIKLYSDAGLTVPLTGQTSIVYAGYIYTVDPSTGIVTAQASPCSGPTIQNITFKNFASPNGVPGSQYSFSLVSDTFGGSVQTLLGGVTTTWGNTSPVVAGTTRSGQYFANASAQLSIAFSNDKGNKYSNIYAFLYINNVQISTISKTAASGILTFPVTLDLSDTSQQITIIVSTD